MRELSSSATIVKVNSPASSARADTAPEVLTSALKPCGALALKVYDSSPPDADTDAAAINSPAANNDALCVIDNVKGGTSTRVKVSSAKPSSGGMLLSMARMLIVRTPGAGALLARICAPLAVTNSGALINSIP